MHGRLDRATGLPVSVRSSPITCTPRRPPLPLGMHVEEHTPTTSPTGCVARWRMRFYHGRLMQPPVQAEAVTLVRCSTGTGHLEQVWRLVIVVHVQLQPHAQALARRNKPTRWLYDTLRRVLAPCEHMQRGFARRAGCTACSVTNRHM